MLATPINAGRFDIRRLFVPVYLWANIGLGGAVLVWALLNWRWDDPLRFASFLAMAVIASIFKVRLPGMEGTDSVSTLFIIIGTVDLSLPEAVALGTVSSLTQCLWRGRPRPVQVSFNVCTLATAIYMSALAYNYSRARFIELVSLGVVALVFFIANAFPVAAIIALTEGKRLRAVWRGNQWALPYYVVGASMAWVIGTAPHAIQWELPIICFPLVYLVHRSNSTYVTQIEREKKHFEEMNAVHLRTIEALALAIDAKDHTTHDHLQRVQHYALEIGKDLKLSEQELEALRAAAVLHDIGKLAVPEHIISKPGKLTRSEFEKMKIHPVVGAEILERVEFPYPVVPIVRAHHEKWDGNGYPNGLMGEQIPIGARILAVVDCLDALASDRQYRRALPLGEAMAKVAAESGTSFDPAVVHALQARYQELEQQVRSRRAHRPPALSKDVKITRGAAPAAGYEDEEAPDAAQITRLQAALEPAAAVNGHSFEAPSFMDSTLRLQEILAVVALRLSRLVTFDAIAFYFWDEEELYAKFVAGDDHRRLSSLRVPPGEGLIGWVAGNSKPIINGNPAVEPGFLDDDTSAPLLKLAMALPFPSGGDRPGVLAIYRSSASRFTSEELSILVPVCSSLGRILPGCREPETERPKAPSNPVFDAKPAAAAITSNSPSPRIEVTA